MKLLKVSCTAVSLLALTGISQAADFTVSEITTNIDTGAITSLTGTLGSISETDLSVNLRNDINDKADSDDIGEVIDLETEEKTVVKAINEVHEDVGNVEDLETKDDETLVGAINEVHSEVDEINEAIGDLEDLETAVEGVSESLVTAINRANSQAASVRADLGNLEALDSDADNLVEAFNEINTNIGDIDDLTTRADDSVVAAINELDGEIGDLSTLETTAKASVVASINEVVTNIGDLDSLGGNAEGQTNLVAAINSVDEVVQQNTGNIRRNSENIDVNRRNIATNSANIASNTSRIVSLEEDVSELRSGVAMAVAIANAPVVSGGKNGISVSGGIGHFQGKTASAVKLAYSPTDTMAINTSVATDFDGGVTAGAGVGFAF